MQVADHAWLVVAGVLVTGCFGEPEVTADDGDATAGDATVGATSTVGDAGTGPGSASTDGSTASDGGSDETVGAGCGNGRVEPGEDCDDGDEDDANGCTRACDVSGSSRWLHVFGSGMGDQRANDVAYSAIEDAFFVVGHRGPSTTIEVWQAKLLVDGTVEFENTIDDPSQNHYAFGVDVAGDGTYVYVGYTDPAGDMFVRRSDPNGTLLASASYGGAAGEQDGGFAVAQAEDGTVLAVGREAFAAGQSHRFLRASQPNLTDVVWTEGAGPVPGTARGVAWSPDLGEFFVAGYEDVFAYAWVRGYGVDGTPGWEFSLPEANETVFSGIAVSGDTVYACGWELAADVPFRERVAALAIESGDLQWDVAWDGMAGAGAYCSDLVVDVQGDLVTVGATLVAGSEDPTPVVRKLAVADGQPRWTTIVSDPTAPVGWFQGVAVAADNTIVAVGNGGGSRTEHVPLVVGLAP